MSDISSLINHYVFEDDGWSEFNPSSNLPVGPVPKRPVSFLDRLKAKAGQASTAFTNAKNYLKDKAPQAAGAAKEILGKAAQHVADHREGYGAAAGAVAGGALGAYKGVRDLKKNSLFGITTKGGRRLAGLQGAANGAEIGSSIGAALAAATRK